MNYKCNQYPNTINGFKKWCNDFPPMTIGKNRQYFSKNGFYMSLEFVKVDYPIFGKPYSFVGKTFRKYNDRDSDFMLCDEEEANEEFSEEIYNYTEVTA